MRARSALVALLAVSGVALAAVAASGGCRLRLGADAAAPAAPLPAPPPPAAASPPPALAGEVLPGSCEASAIVAWHGGWLVGDNEVEGTLLGYAADGTAGEDVTVRPKVEDIEALAPLPDGRLVVVGSQSGNRHGERKPDRERIVVVGPGAVAVRPDLAGCAACEAARGLPPKQGGLSIEGAAWIDGALWLGVRSPLVDGGALLLRMDGDPAVALSVAEVVPVDLAGNGVRDLVLDPRGGVLILAGPADDGPGGGVLYRWRPGAAPERVRADLPPSSEGVALDGAGGMVVVTDGDGKPDAPCVEPARIYRLAAPGAEGGGAGGAADGAAGSAGGAAGPG